jgi:hypothetical protein
MKTNSIDKNALDGIYDSILQAYRISASDDEADKVAKLVSQQSISEGFAKGYIDGLEQLVKELKEGSQAGGCTGECEFTEVMIFRIFKCERGGSLESSLSWLRLIKRPIGGDGDGLINRRSLLSGAVSLTPLFQKSPYPTLTVRGAGRI